MENSSSRVEVMAIRVCRRSTPVKPIHERPVFGRSVPLFDSESRQLTALVKWKASIADLFVL